MTAEALEKQILESLSELQQGMAAVKEKLDLITERVVDDSVLDEEDKAAIDAALEEERKGVLSSKENVFGK